LFRLPTYLVKDLLQPKLQLSRPIKLVELGVLAASAGKLAIQDKAIARPPVRRIVASLARKSTAPGPVFEMDILLFMS
jgi:hypothetical protein